MKVVTDIFTANYLVRSPFITHEKQHYQSSDSTLGITSNPVFLDMLSSSSSSASSSDKKGLKKYTQRRLVTALPPLTIRVLAILTKASSGREDGVPQYMFTTSMGCHSSSIECGSIIGDNITGKNQKASKAARLGLIAAEFMMPIKPSGGTSEKAKEQLPEIFCCQAL